MTVLSCKLSMCKPTPSIRTPRRALKRAIAFAPTCSRLADPQMTKTNINTITRPPLLSSSPSPSPARPFPPPLSIPLHDSCEQDFNSASMSMSLSQQPLCTPVDQVIARTDQPSQQPPSPIRTVVKRRRIQPSIVNKPVFTGFPRTNSTTPSETTSRHQLLLRTDSLDEQSVDNLPPPSTTDDDSSLLNNASLSSQPSSQRDIPLPQFSQDTLALLPNIVREHQLATNIQPQHRQLPQSSGFDSRHNNHSRRHTRSNSTSNSNFSHLPPQHRAIRKSSSSDGLIRASLASALTTAPPMLNPYLPIAPRETRRSSGASESFDLATEGNRNGNSCIDVTTTKYCTTPSTRNSIIPNTPSVSTSACFNFGSRANSQRRKSLKLLLVSLTQQRGDKSASFDMRDLAGRGAFSEVWRAVHRVDGCEYALKKNRVALLSDNARLQSLHEVFALAALQGHPNILRYFDAWFEDGGKFLYLQTEFLPTGNLHERYVDRRIPMSTHLLLALAHDIASALEYMHAKNIAHVDVKPDNIFCSPNRVASTLSVNQFSGSGNTWGTSNLGSVIGNNATDSTAERPSFVIGDFGLACNRHGYGARVTEGDSRYLCPEALSSDEKATEAATPTDSCPTAGTTNVVGEVDSAPQGALSKGEDSELGSADGISKGSTEVDGASKVHKSKDLPFRKRDLCAGDMFSLGATIYELALGTPLHKSGPEWKRLRIHADDASAEVAAKTGSSMLAKIVRRCLTPEPSQRATATEICGMCTLPISNSTSEIDLLRSQLAEANYRISRFEDVLSQLLSKGEQGRQSYRNRNSELSVNPKATNSKKRKSPSSANESDDIVDY